MTGSEPLSFILCFFFSFHHSLNQSQILLKSFLKIAISFSILRLQNVFSLYGEFCFDINIKKSLAKQFTSAQTIFLLGYTLAFVHFIMIFGHQSYVSATYNWNTSFFPFMHYFNQKLVKGIFNIIFWCVPRKIP